MVRPLSNDLRKRVVTAVSKGERYRSVAIWRCGFFGCVVVPALSLDRLCRARQDRRAPQAGEQHQSYVLYGRANGRRVAVYVPEELVPEVQRSLNSITAAYPGRQLHVILDNLNTHKKNEDWLKAHPNVKFHFTPTSASWLNQVEVWFSILQGQSLSGTSFTSLKQLQEHIDAYIKAYNEKAEPFVWTKKKVRQRRFKGRRITQL
jgi:transposase